MKSIQRVVDTRELVTRLYAVGAEGMTFADINGGKAYVEDFTYTNEVRISTLDCSSFTNPYQMKEYAEMRLADYAKPTISYVLNAMDLSVLTGYEHEAWELGDYVRVEDKELGLSVTTRIVRREYNLQEPWNTVLELSTTLKTWAALPASGTMRRIPWRAPVWCPITISGKWFPLTCCETPALMTGLPIGSAPALRRTAKTAHPARLPSRQRAWQA